ncbi:MAG TPA: glycosyltransferase family 39 protein [Gaiellaceae bacterium]|nr:glycosyltransferase family 39 protein [Gaiellaceae bacterium]
MNAVGVARDVRARALAVPAQAWVAALVVCSAAVRMALAHRMVAPWIMVDELIYSELAKSLAEHGSFLVRGVPSTGYGFVYPALIAPAWRLHGSIPDAYATAKQINAVVMSVAAVPAYALARRLLAMWPSLVVAALTVLVPSMLYTGTLMTENAFYPLFLFACLALVATLERPTAFRQIGLLVVCGVCFATRAQAVALFGAAVVAPVLHGLIEQDLRVRLRRFATLYGIVAVVIVGSLGATVARGRSPLELLGAYRAATGAGYSVGDVLHYVLWHIAELDLYVGVVGFAALLTLWFAPRAASPAARAYAAATLPVVVLLVVEVAVFASRQSFRIEERNDFYLTPLFLVPLVGLAAGVVPRRGRAAVAAALVAGVLPVAIPFARFVNPSAVSDTLGLLPWWWLQDQGIHFGPLRFVALAVGLAAVTAFVLVPRRFAPVLVLLTGVYFVLVAVVAENGRHGIRQASAGGLFAGIRKAHPDWIDRRVGRSADVAFLWHYAGETRPLWNNEFFNRSVGTVYTIDGPDAADGGLPETPVRGRRNGTLVTASGRAPVVRYAVSYADIAGTLLERDPGIGLGLYRVNGPLVVLTRVDGVYPDSWGGGRVSYRRNRCAGGTLTVRLGTDEHLFTRPQLVTAREAGSVVGDVLIVPGRQPTLKLPLRPDATETCEVVFTTAITRVPARVQPGSTDTRRLGAHYFAFDYGAP